MAPLAGVGACLLLALSSHALAFLAPPPPPRAPRCCGVQKGNKGEEQAAAAVPAPEFSRPFQLPELGRRMKLVEIEANEEERALLAKRLKLVSIGRLKARLELDRADDSSKGSAPAGGIITVDGEMECEYLQPCAATLEPFKVSKTELFRTLLLEGGSSDLSGAAIDFGEDGVEMEQWDEEVPLGGEVDLGEIAAQYLALGIDRFAKAPKESPNTESP
jgi:hypothetical protein